MTSGFILSIGAALGAWTWVVAGLVLLVAELLAPGAFLLWFGIAAILTGLLAIAAGWLAPALPAPLLSWQGELVVFLVLAVIAVAIGRRVMGGPGRRTAEADPRLNSRAESLVGREAVLVEPLSGGEGRARIDDSLWRVGGPDLPAGARVRIVGARGTRLEVLPASPPSAP